MKKTLIFILAVAASSTHVGAQNLPKANVVHVDGSAHWPDAQKATQKGGVDITAANAALLHTGMSKDQIYALLDVPHYSEGFFVHHWNYLLNIYTGKNAEVISCHMQFHFDSHAHVNDIIVKEQNCADLLKG